jgi:hypothetical protein
VDVLIDTEEKGVPIWDSSDGLITIIGKRHHRPDPPHRIIFGHALAIAGSDSAPRIIEDSPESPVLAKHVGACRWDRSIPSRAGALIWRSR